MIGHNVSAILLFFTAVALHTAYIEFGTAGLAGYSDSRAVQQSCSAVQAAGKLAEAAAAGRRRRLPRHGRLCLLLLASSTTTMYSVENDFYGLRDGQ